MINRDEIEAGDKCYTRDGGCLVAREVDDKIWLGMMTAFPTYNTDGQYTTYDHPLDIIRIEKAPKPVVEEFYIGYADDGGAFKSEDYTTVKHWRNVIKVTTINGKLEKSEQVK